MSLKLLTYPALFRSQKILIVAQYAQVQVDVDTNVTPEVLESKSLHHTVPLLETPEGVLSESNAIARYIARSRPDCKVYGEKGLFEAAQIDSWVDFCANNLEIPATMWIAPILGWMENKPAVTEQAVKDLKKGIMTLEAHLKTRTFFVGRCISLADIAIATTLLLPLKLVLDEKARNEFPHVMRWFDTCVHQAEFAAVIGEVTLCMTPLVPTANAAAGASAEGHKEAKPKESKPKEEKKKKKEKKPKEEKPKEEKPKEAGKRKEKEGDADDEEADDTPVEKKAKNPLDSLPKSTFVLDAWKREYSNPPAGDCYATMPYLWTNFDPTGYSIFIQRYKYNDELSVGYKVSNLVGGFVQRAEDMRKYAFGVMQILGEEGGPMEIVGAWIMRGDSIDAMKEANPDTDSYDWEKITDFNDANKQKIADLFCSWETIDGKKIVDCKVFK